ncbi:hypothetical protein AA21952_2802 [Acetobacter oeni LMG 21952]|nr:hypothetical protein AA21952_2802 [Acetobacter oeni LMG 21952]
MLGFGVPSVSMNMTRLLEKALASEDQPGCQTDKEDAHGPVFTDDM